MYKCLWSRWKWKRGVKNDLPLSLLPFEKVNTCEKFQIEKTLLRIITFLLKDQVVFLWERFTRTFREAGRLPSIYPDLRGRPLIFAIIFWFPICEKHPNFCNILKQFLDFSNFWQKVKIPMYKESFRHLIQLKWKRLNRLVTYLKITR